MRTVLSLLFSVAVAFAQRLAPGNKVRLICEQEPTLSVERTLSPGGGILLPLLGNVQLAGMSLAEAESHLQSLARARLRSPDVLILVSLVQDPLAPVEFYGAVQRTGSAPYRPGMLLKDVVGLASPGAGAATEAVEIRAADGSKVVVDLGSGGGETRLRPGDTVFFPYATTSNEVFVLGGVGKPGSKAYRPGMTASEAIALAGGVTPHGEARKVKLGRKSRDDQVIDLTAAGGAVTLSRGDVLTVPVIENGRFVSIGGFVARPGPVEFRDGMTLSQAVVAAGGLTAFAGASDITVKRLGEWKRRFDLMRIAAGKDQDLILRPADAIEVPAATPRRNVPASVKRPRSGPVVPPR